GSVLASAPWRFNREKLLARAILCGNDAAARELAHYGFGTKINARVAIRAVREKLNNKYEKGDLEGVISRLCQLHRDTRSEPLPNRAVTRLISHLVRRYIGSLSRDDQVHGERQVKFLAAFERLVSLGDANSRLEILSEGLANFFVERIESPEAKMVSAQQLTCPRAFSAFHVFKAKFEQYLREGIDTATTEPVDDCTSLAGR